MLKHTELIDGNVYRAISKYKGSNYIFKNINKGGYEFYITKDIFSGGSKNSFSWDSWELYLATPEESIWMEMCISKNQFIPFEDITFSNKELEIEIW